MNDHEESRTVDHVIRLDLERSLIEDPSSGHNRWHPEIEPILTIRPGEVVRADLRDGLDHQITRNSSHADIVDMDMLRGHPLTGPFLVDGARTGDLIEVEILAIEHHGFGFTCVRPGAGLLASYVPGPFLATWELADGRATSPQISGVTVPEAAFLGIVGVAPSLGRMEVYSAREAALGRRGGSILPPTSQSAIPSTNPIADVGLRTVPPRENGGNLDAKYLRVGSRLLVQAQVDGALLSLGDAHFAQGHGEVCSQAIEMSATVEFRCKVHPSEGRSWIPTMPVILSAEQPATTRSQRLVTTGIPVDGDNTNHPMDLNVAALNAMLAMQDFLVLERGLTPAQAYALSSVAVDLEILEIVNRANVLVGAAIDLSIFDDDQSGTADSPSRRSTNAAFR